MKKNLNQDSSLYLADALVDEIANAPTEALLDEVAEDLGDRQALANEFDAVFASALRRSHRQHLAAIVKNLAAQVSPRQFYKPIWLPVGTLAAMIIAVTVYHGREAGRETVSQTVSVNAQPASSEKPRPAPAVSAISDDNEPARRLASGGVNGSPSEAAAPPASPKVPADLEKAPVAYQTAQAYQSRDRATQASNRGDYATAIASLYDALRYCANRCEPEFRDKLHSDLARAQTALKTSTSVAAAARPQASASEPLLAWPVKGRIIIKFGERTAALRHPLDKANTAEGITIVVQKGSDVHAAGDGVVIDIGNNKTSGKSLRIRHDSDLTTGYGHLSRLRVQLGDQVNRGETIGKAVASGSAAEPQLYFEVRKGSVPVDPLQYLPQD